MNIILLEDSDFLAPNRARISGRRARHIIDVLKAESGTKVRIGVVNDRLGRALITDISNAEIELETELTAPAPPPLPVTLLLALPRPKVLKRVLGTAVTMGVKKIFLFNTWRVEKSYWQTPLIQPEKLKEITLLALEQAVDTVLPEICIKPRFRPFAEDEVPLLAKSCHPALLLHPAAAATPLAPAINKTSQQNTTLIAIGPEGGFIPFEIEMLTASGLQPVSIGPRILKVEQALPAALAHALFQ